MRRFQESSGSGGFYQYGLTIIPGKNDEDSAGILKSAANSAAFAVFDGHGGNFASSYCSVEFCKRVIEEYNKLNTKLLTNKPKELITQDAFMCESIRKATYAVDRAIVASGESGTTATSIFLKRSSKNTSRIYCANTGDSRCIMGMYGKSWLPMIEMSYDHNLQNEIEIERLKKKVPLVWQPLPQNPQALIPNVKRLGKAAEYYGPVDIKEATELIALLKSKNGVDNPSSPGDSNQSEFSEEVSTEIDAPISPSGGQISPVGGQNRVTFEDSRNLDSTMHGTFDITSQKFLSSLNSGSSPKPSSGSLFAFTDKPVVGDQLNAKRREAMLENNLEKAAELLNNSILQKIEGKCALAACFLSSDVYESAVSPKVKSSASGAHLPNDKQNLHPEFLSISTAQASTAISAQLIRDIERLGYDEASAQLCLSVCTVLTQPSPLGRGSVIVNVPFVHELEKELFGVVQIVTLPLDIVVMAPTEQEEVHNVPPVSDYVEETAGTTKPNKSLFFNKPDDPLTSDAGTVALNNIVYEVTNSLTESELDIIHSLSQRTAAEVVKARTQAAGELYARQAGMEEEDRQYIIAPRPRVYQESFIAKRTSGNAEGGPALFGRFNVSTLMSRSIGGKYTARSCVCMPEVTAINIEKHEYARFILASDGLWDLFSSDEIFSTVRSIDDPQTASHTLAKLARKVRERPGHKLDDITVIVVDINPHNRPKNSFFTSLFAVCGTA